MSLNVSQQAYQNTKAEGDPDYSGLQGNYRAELEARADAVIATGVHQTPFETEVLKLHKASVEEAQDSSPLAVGEVRDGLTEEEEAEGKAAYKEAEAKAADGKAEGDTVYVDTLPKGVKELPEGAELDNKTNVVYTGSESVDEGVELHKKTRPELDEIARAEGLNPDDYRNIPTLIEAIEDKRGEA